MIRAPWESVADAHAGFPRDGGRGADPGVISVILADDHWVVRAGLRLLLDSEEGIEVVAEAGDIETALRRCSDAGPTCSFST